MIDWMKSNDAEYEHMKKRAHDREDWHHWKPGPAWKAEQTREPTELAIARPGCCPFVDFTRTVPSVRYPLTWVPFLQQASWRRGSSMWWNYCYSSREPIVTFRYVEVSRMRSGPKRRTGMASALWCSLAAGPERFQGGGRIPSLNHDPDVISLCIYSSDIFPRTLHPGQYQRSVYLPSLLSAWTFGLSTTTIICWSTNQTIYRLVEQHNR